jgi:hypothetical protein
MQKWTATLSLGLAFCGVIQVCAAQTPVQTWETTRESVQQTRQATGPRSSEQEAAARMMLRQFHTFLTGDDVFNPERVAQVLSVTIVSRSGRYSATSPDIITLRPTGQDTPITNVRLILKPEVGQVFRGSEVSISLSSVRFGCITLSDLGAVFGNSYQSARKLPFVPSWPVEIPIDVAIYRVSGRPERTVTFAYHFLDCLGSIETLEQLL